MDKEKSKFTIANHLFWLMPVAATVIFLLYRLISGASASYEFTEKAMDFNSFVVIPLLCFVYIIAWLLGCSYHKKTDKDERPKRNLTNCVICGLVLLAACFILRFFNMNLDISAVAFLAGISEITGVSFHIYRIVL